MKAVRTPRPADPRCHSGELFSADELTRIRNMSITHLENSIAVQQPIKAIFFDIGNTLGAVDRATKTLTPFLPVAALLKSFCQVLNIPIGVISNTPDDWTPDDIRSMLDRAGLLPFLDPNGIVTSVSAGASKPALQIYQFAAHRFGLATAECLFIDDEIANVTGACAAGMSAIHKPTP